MLPRMRASTVFLLGLFVTACGASEPPLDTVTDVPTAETATPPRRERRPRKVENPAPVDYAACIQELRQDGRVVESPDGAQSLYAEAYGAERDNDTERARKRYLELIQKYPKSAYVPPAYFAFGWMFAADAKSDPSKWAFVEEAMLEVLKYPDARVRVAAYVELGRALIAEGYPDRAALNLREAKAEGITSGRFSCADASREEAEKLEVELVRPEAD